MSERKTSFDNALRDLRDKAAQRIDAEKHLRERQSSRYRLRWERAENGIDWRADVCGGWFALACRRSPGVWYVVVEQSPGLRIVTRHVEGLPAAKRIARQLVTCDLDALLRAVKRGMGER